MKKKIAIFIGHILTSNLEIFLKEDYEIGFFIDSQNPQQSSDFQKTFSHTFLLFIPLISLLSSLFKNP
ncbi:hypothetical protein HC766_02010 [Candidatus Gracilibacteria bacterium]|nr:hypothetical protein [Candidatus Gracilibacteria bacterium]